jgi:magnesium transporter
MLDIFLLNLGAGPVTQMSGDSDVGKIRKGTPCWFDLYDPTDKEEQAVERFLGIGLPTRGEMSEIEASSRIYAEGPALFLTISLVAGAQRPVPHTDAMTFVLVGNCLATIRYHDPTPLRTFKAVLTKAPSRDYPDGGRAMVGLLDTSIDRLADILEIIGADLEALSREVFSANSNPKTASDPQAALPEPTAIATAGGTGTGNGRAPSMRSRVRPNDRDLDLRQTISQLGRGGDLISKSRESLVSINRVLVFLDEQAREGGHCPQPPEVHAHLGNLRQDIQSLLDHANFLNGKVSFLLDATLGLINVEQNQIIKIFSIAAVIFLPPTLVASVYGMNFKHMPELEFASGYPLALTLMVISAILPYLFFKHKGWV